MIQSPRPSPSPRRIAVLDSGIGGLPLFTELSESAPKDCWLYLADTLAFPYGDHSFEEITGRLRYWLTVFQSWSVTDVVLACGTASVAFARSHLGEEFSRLPVHGLVEAGARAAAWSRAEVIGVVATSLTVESQAYPDAIRVEVVNRPLRVVQRSLPELAPLIEAGETDGAWIRALVAGAVEAMLQESVQALVLGCTHYPLIRRLWRDALPPGVALIDPAVELARCFPTSGSPAVEAASYRFFFTSKESGLFSQRASQALGRAVVARAFSPACPF